MIIELDDEHKFDFENTACDWKFLTWHYILHINENSSNVTMIMKTKKCQIQVCLFVTEMQKQPQKFNWYKYIVTDN